MDLPQRRGGVHFVNLYVFGIEYRNSPVSAIFGVFSGAILLTFIFNYTKGSILAVSIWHLTYDLVSMICKEGLIPAIVSLIIMVIALIILIRYKWTNLSPYERITWKTETHPQS